MTNRLLAAVCVGLAGVVALAQGPAPQPPVGTGLIVGQVVDALTGRGVPDVAVTIVQPGYQRPGGAMTNPRPVLSDAEGRFVFRGLPASTFQITARRSGYAESLYGALNADGDGKAITLAEGGRFGDAKIQLWRLGAIGGTVVDDAGDPIIGLQVRAFKRNLIAGRWKFGEYYSNQHYGAKTDDRGVYRIFDIEPGEYIVYIPLTTSVAPAAAVAELEALRADPSARAAFLAANESFSTGSFVNTRLPQYGAGSAMTIGVGDALQTLVAPGLAPVITPAGPWLMYQTQFYPGSSLSTSALPISMKAGQEVNGIDFAMKPVRTWRVSGTVSGLPASGAVSLRLVTPDSETLLDETEVAATLSAADGAFAFVGVPAGRYLIKVLRVPVLPDVVTQMGSSSRSEQAQGVSVESTLWASVPVTVGGSDVNGVAVALGTGVRASGRVVFEGVRPKPTAAQLASVEITIEAASGERPLIFKSDRVRLSAETFQTAELAPGKYIVRSNAPAGWVMKSATSGSKDLRDTPLVVDGHDIPPITVTYTDRSLASLGGTVRSATGLTDAFVCVFPVEREAWVDYGGTPRRVRRVQPNQAGVYRIPDVPAGEYFVAAVASDRSPDWRDPKHLDALSRIASRVVFAAEEAKTLDLSAQRTPATSPSSHAADLAADLFGTEIATSMSGVSSGPFVADDDARQTPPRATPRATPQPTGGGSVTGVITTDGTNPAPIRRVIVVLNSTDPKVGRTTLTDDAGRFTFASLPAARYSVTATKPGYLDLRYGATRPGRPGTPVVLAENERSAITMTMAKGSVITGTIRDARGEPVRGVAVNLSQYVFTNGERRLNLSGRSEQTDDRGQYRIYGLEAGEYFVNVESANLGFYRSLRQTTAEDFVAAQRDLRATASTPVAAATAEPPPEMGYAPAFYPGTTLFSQAAAVSVGAGEEKAGVDIALQLVPLAHLYARVLGPDGQPPAMVQGRLVAQVALPGLSLVGLESGTIRPVTDGNIRINSIPPGEYTLHAGGSTIAPPPMAASSSGGFSSGGTTGLPMWASMPVTIAGRNIDDLTIQLQLGKRMTGRVVFEGTTPPPATVSFFLNGPPFGGTTLSSRGTATPEFSIDGIIPAAYRVTFTPTGVRGWTVKSALIDGRDAADLPVDISSDVADVVITLTDKLTEFSGVLQTSTGTPLSNYSVIVFAKDPAYWFSGSRRIVSLRPATDGRFVTTATAPLPPGDYLVAAVIDVRPGEWFDPAFLKTLTGSAVVLTLSEGEKKRQDLQIK